MPLAMLFLYCRLEYGDDLRNILIHYKTGMCIRVSTDMNALIEFGNISVMQIFDSSRFAE